MKKRILNVIGAFITALISYGFLSQTFSGAIQAESMKLDRQKAVLERMQVLVKDQPVVEKAWKEKEALFDSSRSKEEVLNQWMRDLTGYGQLQKLDFQKMEPLKKDEGSVRLFLSFQGTSKRLIHFLYFLFEKQPLTQLESLIIEQDAEESPFYEIVLRKEHHV